MKKMININEDGEPTNSNSAGSMDSHSATDGKICQKDTEVLTRKGKKKKMSKYKQYKEETMKPQGNNLGRVTPESGFEFSAEYETKDVAKMNLINLDISPEDYVIVPENKTVEFRFHADMINFNGGYDGSEDIVLPKDDEIYDKYYDIP